MENQEKQKGQGGEINDSPIEQVRLTVPISDDPTLPTLTIRTWVIGIITCAILSFLTQFFNYRQNTIILSNGFIQILIVVIGKLMAKSLPSTLVKVPGTNWAFSMNPGPFSIKENVLTTILATSGLDNPYGIVIVPVMKVFYRKHISFWPALLVTQTSQMLGYGFAGIFMKYLVQSPYMWYPLVLTNVSFYSSLHDVEFRSKGRLTKLQFLLIASISSFAYAIIPGYFFPSIGALSFICWIWKKSVVAQLIGSGRRGFGIGSFAVDWTAISGFLGNPLVLPFSTIMNTMGGFILFLYVVAPILYFTNSFDAKRFPLFSSDLFDYSGQAYDISKVLNEKDLTFNQQGYDNYSKLYLSTVFLLSTGCGLALITASVTHFIIYYGRDVCRHVKQAWENKHQIEDVHNRLMKKYKPIPNWWFIVILIPTLGLSIFSCEGFGKQLQLPYWGVLLGCLYTLILILPLGVLQAVTGQYDILPEMPQLVMGYLYPGRPIANLVLKSYSIATLYHALNFTSELKLAHYMKIPPKTMFATQVTATFITSLVSFVTSWWLLSTVKNMCDIEKLPTGSPWTCPGEQVTFDRTVIWGVIGPGRLFYPHGLYANLYYFFLIGVLAPLLIWGLSKFFPRQKWISLINVPNMLTGVTPMPVAGPVNYWSWFTLGTIFSLIVYRRYKGWWARYNYVLANGLEIGVAFLAVLTSVALQLQDIYGVNWWGLDVGDHCDLATCPTASGVVVEGCPTF